MEGTVSKILSIAQQAIVSTLHQAPYTIPFFTLTSSMEPLIFKNIYSKIPTEKNENLLYALQKPRCGKYTTFTNNTYNTCAYNKGQNRYNDINSWSGSQLNSALSKS